MQEKIQKLGSFSLLGEKNGRYYSGLNLNVSAI